MVEVISRENLMQMRVKKVSDLRKIVGENLPNARFYQNEADSFTVSNGNESSVMKINYNNEIYVTAERDLVVAMRLAKIYESRNFGKFLIVRDFE